MSIIITLTALGFSGVFAQTPSLECAEYLRIHIRADSNAQEAQAVKYRVRDDVVEYLTPLVAGYRDKDAAMAGVAAHLDEISAVATATLKEYGYSYSATAELTVEDGFAVLQRDHGISCVNHGQEDNRGESVPNAELLINLPE